MKLKKATCDRCGFYFSDNQLYKREDGKKYCKDCRAKIERETFKKAVSRINTLIEALLKVPPPPKETKKKKSKNKSSLKARKK